MMLAEKLLRKIMCMGWNKFIGGFVDMSSRSIFNVDFKGFRFSKVYKRFGVKKVKKEVFYVIKFII